MGILSYFFKVSSEKQRNRKIVLLMLIFLCIIVSFAWITMPHHVRDQYGQPLSILAELSHIWVPPFIAGATFGSLSMAILFYIKFKKDSKEYYKVADFYRGMYFHQARNVYHNIRTFLSHFRVLVEDNEVPQAVVFSNKAAVYLTSALNMVDWEFGKWTFQNEIDYFFTYLDLHNASSAKKINFILQYDNIEAPIIRMVPDIFITLLQNSITHGYKKEQNEWSFSICAKVMKNHLEIEVKDNGIPEDVNGFEKAKGRLSGLDVLRNKVGQNWSISGKYLNRNLKSVEFNATKENGTKVIIRIPYETIAPRTYS